MFERLLDALALPSFLIILVLGVFMFPALLAGVAWIVHDAYAPTSLARKLITWLHLRG